MARIVPVLSLWLALTVLGTRPVFAQSGGATTPPADTIGRTATPPTAFAGVRFPAVADSFTNTRVSQQTNRLIGVTGRYTSTYFERAIVDVYLYPVLPGQDTLPSEEAIGRAEYERSRDEVMAFRDAPGQPNPPELLSEDSIAVEAVDGRTYRGWRADFFVSFGNERARSHMFVFRKDGGTVKFRISHPRELEESMTPHVERFLGEMLGGVGLDPVWAEGRPAQDPFAADLGEGRAGGIGFPMRVDSLMATAATLLPTGEINVQDASAVDRRFTSSVRLRPAPAIREELIRSEFLPRALEVRSRQLRGAPVPEGATIEIQVEAVTDVRISDDASVPISLVEMLLSTDEVAVHAHYFDFMVGAVNGQLRFSHDQALTERMHPSIEGVAREILRMAQEGR